MAFTQAERVKYGPQQQHTARLRYLPAQLEAARHKVRALENEARRYGMAELLERPDGYCDVNSIALPKSAHIERDRHEEAVMTEQEYSHSPICCAACGK